MSDLDKRGENGLRKGEDNRAKSSGGKVRTASLVTLVVAGGLIARAVYKAHFIDPPKPVIPVVDPSLQGQKRESDFQLTTDEEEIPETVTYEEAVDLVKKMNEGRMHSDHSCGMNYSGDFLSLLKKIIEEKRCTISGQVCFTHASGSFTVTCGGVNLTFSTSSIVSISGKIGTRSKSYTIKELLGDDESKTAMTLPPGFGNSSAELPPDQFIDQVYRYNHRAGRMIDW